MKQTSLLTHKTYETSNVIYMSNPKQFFFYLSTIGYDHLLDILPGDNIKQDMAIFVWEKCKETAECKKLWDERGKNRDNENK